MISGIEKLDDRNHLEHISILKVQEISVIEITWSILKAQAISSIEITWSILKVQEILVIEITWSILKVQEISTGLCKGHLKHSLSDYLCLKWESCDIYHSAFCKG